MPITTLNTNDLRITDTFTNGFGNYNDTATSTTPLTVVASTPKQLECDGLGSQTDESFLPTGVTSFFDSVTNRVILNGLAVGDVFHIRVDCVFTPSNTNSLSFLEFDFYDSSNNFIFTTKKFLLYQKTTTASQIVDYSTFYCGTDILDSSVVVSLLSDTNGSLVVNGVTVFAFRRPL